VRKDVLYCDSPDDLKRRSMRTVFDQLFICLTTWMAPVLCFTAEEAWRSRYGADSSVHMQTFPEIPGTWHNEELASRFADVRKVRKLMTGALEGARSEGKIGSSLQAVIEIYDPEGTLPPSMDWAEIAITSGATALKEKAPAHAYTLPEIPNMGVVVKLASGEKCQRCWKVLEEVGTATPEHQLCNRCTDVVRAQAHMMRA
jgi:isoleucyl-tRNA synthetase